jgi:hypothetical protein
MLTLAYTNPRTVRHAVQTTARNDRCIKTGVVASLLDNGPVEGPPTREDHVGAVQRAKVLLDEGRSSVLEGSKVIHHVTRWLLAAAPRRCQGPRACTARPRVVPGESQ